MDPRSKLPDWERLSVAERHVQALVPGTVLVGGTARKVPPPFHAYPADAPVACELLVLKGERLRLRVPGRLIANGVRLGPFTFDLPPRGSVGWHLRPSDAPVPDEDAYRRASGPVPPTRPPPERP